MKGELWLLAFLAVLNNLDPFLPIGTKIPSTFNEFVVICPALSTNWFISHQGSNDAPECGRRVDTPCRTLMFVLERSNQDDIIHIDGGGGNYAYELCHARNPGFISVTFLGENGRPVILPCRAESTGIFVPSFSDFINQTKTDNADWRSDEKLSSAQKTGKNGGRMTSQDSVSNEEKSATDPQDKKENKPQSQGTVQSKFLTEIEMADFPAISTHNNTTSHKRNVCSIAFHNLQFYDLTFEFSNCSVIIHNSIFVNSTITALNSCLSIRLKVYNSTIYGEMAKFIADSPSRSFHAEGTSEINAWDEDVNNYMQYSVYNNEENNFKKQNTRAKKSNLSSEQGRQNVIECVDVFIRFERVIFKVTTVSIKANGSSEITVIESTFTDDAVDDFKIEKESEERTKPRRGTEHMGGLHLTLNSISSDLLIRRTNFQYQMHPSMTDSVINLHEAALWIKAVSDGGPQSPIRTKVMVEGCRFVGNERALTLVGPFKELTIRDSEFLENKAVHAGAAILVHLNTECCKGVVMLVGKGGAMRVQRGRVDLRGSRFYDNRARLLGSSVFLDIDGQLNMTGCYFENNPNNMHALQGDIIYSDGQMNVDDVRMVAKTASNGLSIFRHSGNHWSLAITDVWVQCPIGFDLRATNSSAYGVHHTGLRRSHYVDQLSYFCESCQRNRYSLDFGYLNYTMMFHTFAYFTLLINGSVPKPEYTGNYDHHKIRCDDCPYGGQCIHNIAAIPNFWGFEDRMTKSVKFQHCPKGYCCSAEPCSTIHQCAPLREGRLCGRCMRGYSEAWFSTRCVADTTCGSLWLYLLFFSLGIFYCVFLMLQTDLKQLIFTKPPTIQSTGSTVTSSSRRRSSVPILDNRRRSRSYEGKQRKSSQKYTEERNHVAETELTTQSPESSRLVSSPNGDGSAKRKRSSSIAVRQKPRKPSYWSRQLPVITLLQYDTQSSGDNVKAYDSGCIVTLVYYFQDALLLHISTVYDSPESRTEFFARSTIAGLFRFELDVFELLHETCAFAGMTPVPKLISQALLIPYILLIFVVIRLASQILRGARSAYSSSYKFENDYKLDTRVLSGIILALLFMYQKLGTTAFTLLNCVPVNGERVLYVDGTITCYQYWQYGIMFYAIFCLTPFCLVLLFGPKLLSTGRISNLTFFVACIIPPPFLIFWVCRWARTRLQSNDGSSKPRAMSPGTRAIVRILQGPFRENSQGWCWTGVLVGRRLILILLWTFVNDALIRLLAMLLVCFVILLNHVDVQPYRDTAGNTAGTLAAAGLVTMGTINLIRATFETAEYDPSGPNQTLMRVFEQIENMLIIWIPLSAVTLIAIKLIAKLIVLRFRAICGSMMSKRRDSDITELQLTE